ncbi:putative RNA-directed DNA polymerase from transposon BS [Araneus ventricosus]|uniref:Putative RNA-directed DNA polymerase from transposon BS n=1 Tax=Araneus ventricosus TaxID=182803 RepID=A0A4Y2IHW1_ARAVE|nr:putative RNA-directed DNA polymerase from transposon BS [Araneus ventricosus]
MWKDHNNNSWHIKICNANGDSIIIPIHKPGKDPHNTTNYRPISLLSSLSKVVEKIILNRLEPEVEHQLIPYQFRFRKNHSTISQLLRMTEITRQGWSESKYIRTVFLDVAKAFDEVWTTGLIYKLIELNMLDSLIKLLISYLTNRNFKVRVASSF